MFKFLSIVVLAMAGLFVLTGTADAGWRRRCWYSAPAEVVPAALAPAAATAPSVGAQGQPRAGNDVWALGITTTLPIWHRKYSAMQAAASSRHLAAHATEDEVALRLDALLRNLWEQARAGQQNCRALREDHLAASPPNLRGRPKIAGKQQGLLRPCHTRLPHAPEPRTGLSSHLGSTCHHPGSHSSGRRSRFTRNSRLGESVSQTARLRSRERFPWPPP